MAWERRGNVREPDASPIGSPPPRRGTAARRDGESADARWPTPLSDIGKRATRASESCSSLSVDRTQRPRGCSIRPEQPDAAASSAR